MSQLLLAGLCGIAGGIIAALSALAFFMRKVKGSDCLMISRSPGQEIYKEVEILEHAPRPQGLYVRYRNCGTKPIEMAEFKVRGFKENLLWAEFEEGAYAETQPGQQQEAILKLHDNRDPCKTVDLVDCRVEVTFLYGFVLAKKPA
jgi:hypothetical protein